MNRHDTPVDEVSVVDAAQLALARLRRLETIDSAYEAWAQLLIDRRARVAHFAAEYRRIDDQGSLVLGAVRTASSVAHTAVLEGPESGLELFLTDSRAKLEALRGALVATEAAERASFDQAVIEISRALHTRVAQRAKVLKPVLRVMVRAMPDGQRILHAERVSIDDSIALFFVLTGGRIPSRYEYLFDDSTDDPTAVPPWAYPDEGVVDTRPQPAALASLLELRPEVWPVKGMIPLWLPGERRMARWLQRGAVMEAEVADGAGFRNLLGADEAERLLGLMLSLKMAGTLELELSQG